LRLPNIIKFAAPVKKPPCPVKGLDRIPPTSPPGDSGSSLCKRSFFLSLLLLRKCSPFFFPSWNEKQPMKEF
jgi:hypothetical protein